jgi:hypothetical protein
MQTHQTHNPKEIGNKPPFPQKRQPQPGSQKDMQPQPDFGLKTYKGADKLTGMTAIITGADSGWERLFVKNPHPTPRVKKI